MARGLEPAAHADAFIYQSISQEHPS